MGGQLDGGTEMGQWVPRREETKKSEARHAAGPRSDKTSNSRDYQL